MNHKFFVLDIPKVLDPRPEIDDRLLTLEQVETIMEHNDQAILPTSGDCLEAVQVVDGGWVAVDFTRFPAPPRSKNKGGDGSTDVCMCYAVYPGRRVPAVMCKEYLGVWGPWQMVGTRYDLKKGKHRMDCGMEAKRIFGVVFASWDADGRLLWERARDSFPEQLGTMPTIHGDNIGDPLPLPEVKKT